MVNFFTKISSTNKCGKFLFSFLPCHMGKAKLKEVLVYSPLSAQQIVYNYLKASKKNVHDIEITNKMRTSWKSAHSRYLIALEDAKRQSQVTEKETKRKLIKTDVI